MPTDTILVVIAIISMFAAFALAMLWADYHSRSASAETPHIKDGKSHL